MRWDIFMATSFTFSAMLIGIGTTGYLGTESDQTQLLMFKSIFETNGTNSIPYEYLENVYENRQSINSHSILTGLIFLVMGIVFGYLEGTFNPKK